MQLFRLHYRLPLPSARMAPMGFPFTLHSPATRYRSLPVRGPPATSFPVLTTRRQSSLYCPPPATNGFLRSFPVRRRSTVSCSAANDPDFWLAVADVILGLDKMKFSKKGLEIIKFCKEPTADPSKFFSPAFGIVAVVCALYVAWRKFKLANEEKSGLDRGNIIFRTVFLIRYLDLMRRQNWEAPEALSVEPQLLEVASFALGFSVMTLALVLMWGLF